MSRIEPPLQSQKPSNAAELFSGHSTRIGWRQRCNFKEIYWKFSEIKKQNKKTNKKKNLVKTDWHMPKSSALMWISLKLDVSLHFIISFLVFDDGFYSANFRSRRKTLNEKRNREVVKNRKGVSIESKLFVLSAYEISFSDCNLIDEDIDWVKS